MPYGNQEIAAESGTQAPVYQCKDRPLDPHRGRRRSCHRQREYRRCLCCTRLQVYESEEKGLSVLNPSSKYQKDGKSQYSDVIHAVTPEARTAINDAILEAYEQKLQEEQGEDLDEDLGQGQTM